MVVFGSRVRDTVLWFGIVMNTMVDCLVGWDCDEHQLLFLFCLCSYGI